MPIKHTDQNESCSRIREKISLVAINMDLCNLCALMGTGAWKEEAAVVL